MKQLLRVSLSWALALVTAAACSDGSADGGDGDGDSAGDGDGDDNSVGDGDGDGGGEGGRSSVGDWMPGDDVPLGVDGAVGTLLSGIPRAIAYQGDNIIIVGTSEGEVWGTRLTPEGRVDTSFSDDGDVLIAFPEGETLLNQPADFDVGFGVQVAGEAIFIAAAVRGWNGLADTRWGVVKLDEDGALDSSFADEGTKLIDWTIGSRAYRISVDEGGRLYVAGTIENASTDIAVVRLLDDGAVDDSFSLTGSGPGAVVSNNEDEHGLSLLVGADGVFVSGSPDFGVAGLQLDGTYDDAFGVEGWSKTTEGEVYAMEAIEDGKLLLAGTAPIAPDSESIEELQLVRLLSDGSLDEAFADGGIARISYDFESYVFPPAYEEFEFEDAFVRINGLSLLPDGGVLLLADIRGFLTRYPALLRVTADGVLDTEFGQEGLVAFPVGLPLLAGFVPEPASRLVSDGTKAWIAEEVLLDGEAHGIVIEVDLEDL